MCLWFSFLALAAFSVPRPPSPGGVVVMNAFTWETEIRICKQTALADCVPRLCERFQVLLVSGL